MAARADKQAAPPPYRRHRARSDRRRLPVLLAAVAVVAMLAGFGAPLLTSLGASDGPVALAPGMFSAGACLAYPPTHDDRHRTVFLDAGHGGIDPGGVGTTGTGRAIAESSVNLPVELDTMALLRADGFRVVVSRTRDTTVVRLGPGDEADGALTLQGAHDDVAARDVCANLAHADLLVGIYMDAGAAGEAGSITAYDPDRPFAAANERFASRLQSDVLSAMNAQGWGIPDGGAQPDTNLGSYVGSPGSGGLASKAAAYNHLLLLGPGEPGFFSTPSQMPGAVIEPLFLTDPFEGSIAASRRGQQVIAGGIATAIEAYLRR